MKTPTLTEAYLLDFHQRIVSSTSIAFGSLPASLNGIVYASSYHALASMLPIDSRSLSVLDIGCGDGHLLGLLSAQRHRELRLSGVDMSDGELNVARATLPKDVLLLKEQAQNLSIETGTIDVVLSHMALMLMDDIEQVLSEIHRVLRPSGTLAFVVGGKGMLEPFKHLYLNELRPILREEKISTRFGDPRTGTKEGWQTLLSSSFKDCSFSDVTVEFTAAPMEIWNAFLSTTYDVDLLSLRGQEKLRHRVLSTLSDHCDNNRTLRVEFGLQLVTAKSA